ncbi:putative membrane protein [Pseudomonas syringae pv. avii]|uniref:Membrane protein n=1 Tax=Pseudomonas syringae pv. avii TaxID=663959 RepID=A0ABY1U8J5_PSESX|nr:hypothetical protein AO286_12285 [Pseudomonas syringae]SOS27681.1 putative membrane protein [Pseudomonas syringae pv. avii]
MFKLDLYRLVVFAMVITFEYVVLSFKVKTAVVFAIGAFKGEFCGVNGFRRRPGTLKGRDLNDNAIHFADGRGPTRDEFNQANARNDNITCIERF